MKQPQQGLGMISAIVILVILASLGGAIVSLGSSQHMMSAQDVMAAKAWQASKAGNEWGLYFALKTQTWPSAATTCDTASFGAPIAETLDLTADTGFHVKVSCESRQYNEGETAPGVAKTVRIYRITSVACNAATCPAANASAAGYVERTRVVLATN